MRIFKGLLFIKVKMTTGATGSTDVSLPVQKLEYRKEKKKDPLQKRILQICNEPNYFKPSTGGKNQTQSGRTYPQMRSTLRTDFPWSILNRYQHIWHGWFRLRERIDGCQLCK